MARLAICSVTYNRKDLTEQWFTALMTHFPPEGKLYIADNGSKDGTAEFLKKQLIGDVIEKIVYHDTNQGKGPAMNELFKLAAKEGTEYIVSIDSDIIVGQAWWNQLESVFLEHKKEKMGWVSPIYYDENSPVPHSRKEMYEIGKTCEDYIDEIGCAGGMIMFPKEMYDNVGGYVNKNKYGGIDGTYLHICRKAGYRCGYTTRCVVRHLRGGSEYDAYEKWKNDKQKSLHRHGVFTYKVTKGYWDQ